MIGGASGFAGAAILAAFGISGLTGAAVPIALFGIALAAAAGGLVGGAVGNAIYNFNRLLVENTSTITLSGCVLCAGKNDGIYPWADGDWTFNLGGSSLMLCGPTTAGLNTMSILTTPAPGNGQQVNVIQDQETQQIALHCEISSNIGNYAAVGTAVGAVAGGAAGAAAGAAACASLALATFGIGGALCLLILAAATLFGRRYGRGSR